MNKDEFKKLLRSKYLIKRIFEYLIVVVAIAFGLFFIYKQAFTIWNHDNSLNHMSPSSIYVIGFISILTGVWGFFRIRKNYEIVSFRSDQVFVDMSKLITGLTTKLNWTIIDGTNDPIELIANDFWENGHLILITLEGNKIHFDVQHNSIGIIDLGVRRRIIRKLVIHLNSVGIKRCL